MNAHNNLVVSIKHHKSKAAVLAEILESRGYQVVDATDMDAPIGDVLLIDHDLIWHGNRERIKRFYDAGKPVFIYPHGAAPLLFWDGIHEPSDMVTGNLVTSQGHVEVMRRYGYSKPNHVIGWYLCKQKQWKPTAGKKILFAPIHPIGGGFMFPEDRAVNTRTYERLLEIDGISITIRHLMGLEVNGLWEQEGVRIYQGMFDNNYNQIDLADLVISNGTMAYMAVARGKPVIMMNQLTPAREWYERTNERLVSASIEKYEAYMRFPFDVDDNDNLGDIIQDACKREPIQWKKRFIGDQLGHQAFCDQLDRLVQ